MCLRMRTTSLQVRSNRWIVGRSSIHLHLNIRVNKWILQCHSILIHITKRVEDHKHQEATTHKETYLQSIRFQIVVVAFNRSYKEMGVNKKVTSRQFPLQWQRCWGRGRKQRRCQACDYTLIYKLTLISILHFNCL
jgi:hypothetical protein